MIFFKKNKYINKEGEWQGYYSDYVRRAKIKGISALEMLDQEWADGLKTAQNFVAPYIKKDFVVLEIACGIGRVSRFVAPYCRQLYCADILDSALVLCKNNLKNFKNVSFSKINGYDLKCFQNNFFDLVYSFTAFFHFDFELVVNYFFEIRRVLKPNGIAIIEFKQWKSEKDIVQLLNKIQEAGGIEKYEKKLGKWRYVSADALKVLCDYCQFKILDKGTTKFSFQKKG